MTANFRGPYVGMRVQRIGWQLTALGTVRKIIVMPDERYLYIVEWDFRGMQNDITTIWGSDIVPVSMLEEFAPEMPN